MPDNSIIWPECAMTSRLTILPCISMNSARTGWPFSKSIITSLLAGFGYNLHDISCSSTEVSEQLIFKKLGFDVSAKDPVPLGHRSKEWSADKDPNVMLSSTKPSSRDKRSISPEDDNLKLAWSPGALPSSSSQTASNPFEWIEVPVGNSHFRGLA